MFILHLPSSVYTLSLVIIGSHQLAHHYMLASPTSVTLQTSLLFSFLSSFMSKKQIAEPYVLVPKKSLSQNMVYHL